MYRTYAANEEKPVYPYEERLVPKEVNVASHNKAEEERQPEIETDSISGGLFENIGVEELVIIGLLIFLLYEDCDDWVLILALIALLFIR